MSLLQNFWFQGFACFGIGLLVGAWFWRWRTARRRAEVETERMAILENARRSAETAAREAKLQAEEEIFELRERTEASFASRRESLVQSEKQLSERERSINQQWQRLEGDTQKLHEQTARCAEKEQVLAERQAELDKLVRQRRRELQQLSGLSDADARQMILQEVELDALKDATRLTRRIMNDAQERAEEKARRIISLAIQRYASDTVNETSSATVALPSEDIKGRIIGREGRNIRAFEAATGVTVLIDDTPNAVVLSAFDPVRRVIARETMQRLLADGRIHPTRIEEVVAKVSQEMEETIIRFGEDAVHALGLPPMHVEIVRLLGRLKFRHSFSQNVLDHSVEVGHLTGLLAAELGLDVPTAKRAGLLHDLGKAVNHEVEGAHAIVGAEIIRRYGEQDIVVNAVASHHDEVPHNGPLGILVGAADAISASRPGARSETMTAYIKRVEALERIGGDFEGVEKCFAVQAGRELRVMVQPGRINDDEASALARRISKRIEEELHYPGQIRVTVVRETRCVEYAK